AGNRKHRPERCFHPRSRQKARVARVAGCLAEHAGECLAESAVRFEPGLEAGIERWRAVVQRAHGRPQPARTLIGLKSHSEATLEAAPDLDGIQAPLPQILVPQPKLR